MARTGGKTYVWIAVAYTVIGLYFVFRRPHTFGLMWLFFGFGALAEYLLERNQSWWLNAAKWTSVCLGIVMLGLWIFVRQ